MARVIAPKDTGFTATGIIGNNVYNIRKQNKLRVVVESVGGTNVITVRGKIDGAAAFDVINTVTGANSGQFDISDYDLIQFDCTTYDSTGGAKLLASKFV